MARPGQARSNSPAVRVDIPRPHGFIVKRPINTERRRPAGCPSARGAAIAGVGNTRSLRRGLRPLPGMADEGEQVAGSTDEVRPFPTWLTVADGVSVTGDA